jgi:hypothetical protein
LLTQVFPLADYAEAFGAAMDKRRYRSVKVALDLDTTTRVSNAASRKR